MARLVATLLVLAAGAAAGDPPRIQWSKDLASGIAEAKRDNRPLLLYFTFET